MYIAYTNIYIYIYEWCIKLFYKTVLLVHTGDTGLNPVPVLANSTTKHTPSLFIYLLIYLFNLSP